jgi:capsular polysaccharide transport system permease protein
MAYADDDGGHTQIGIPAERPNASAGLYKALRIQIRVVGALTLRDLRTRFGGTYVSYSIAVMWPLTHLVVLAAAYTLIGRQPSYGTDTFTWVLSGTLPFVVFLYGTRAISQSLSANASLLSFSIVRRIDLLLARALVELVTAIIIGTIMFSIFVLLRGPLAFADFQLCVLAVLLTYWTGLAFGSLAAPIVRIWPAMLMVMQMFVIICWITAGIVYLPDSVPEPFHTYLAYNPLVHCSELLRFGLYDDYQSRTMDIDYLMTLTSVLILMGLSLERAIPRLATWIN